jgi:hypothetical protein
VSATPVSVVTVPAISAPAARVPSSWMLLDARAICGAWVSRVKSKVTGLVILPAGSTAAKVSVVRSVRRAVGWQGDRHGKIAVAVETHILRRAAVERDGERDNSKKVGNVAGDGGIGVGDQPGGLVQHDPRRHRVLGLAEGRERPGENGKWMPP